jgi:hypothetical protein
MRTAEQLDDLAHYWELFLIFHQRTWNKCETQYKGQAFWGPLFPKYSAKRKHSDVLVYVHHARHANEHGIQAIAQVQPGSTTVDAGSVLTGGSQIIGGGAYVLGYGSVANVKVTPSYVQAARVIVRGQGYEPPVLDGSLNPPVLRVAEESIKFFDDLFAEIDAAGGD